VKALLPLLLLLTSPAVGQVTSSNQNGFAILRTAHSEKSPAAVYAALAHPEHWWSSAHTYSGASRNLSLTAKAGGCFCETVPSTGATIEHGRVIYAKPGMMLRLSAALGPLQAEAVTGTLTWTLKPASGGTDIEMTYVVGGYIRGGAAAYAKPVDTVLAEQLERFVAYSNR
jgi:uncharacterized protein YndB with AHSA1/START domain